MTDEVRKTIDRFLLVQDEDLILTLTEKDQRELVKAEIASIDQRPWAYLPT